MEIIRKLNYCPIVKINKFLMMSLFLFLFNNFLSYAQLQLAFDGDLNYDGGCLVFAEPHIVSIYSNNQDWYCVILRAEGGDGGWINNPPNEYWFGPYVSMYYPRLYPEAGESSLVEFDQYNNGYNIAVGFEFLQVGYHFEFEFLSYYAGIQRIALYDYSTMQLLDKIDLYIGGDPDPVYSLIATNNWNGTVDLSWNSGSGDVRIYRDGSFIKKVSGGTSYTDKVPQPGKEYTYLLKDSSGTPLCDEVKITPEVVVVLVRGYAPKGDGYSSDYWDSDSDEQNKGLVPSVFWWFHDRNITCWDASSVLNGKKSIEWNADKLSDFIDSKRIGVYSNAKVHLVAHSMGGLISRRYAYKQKGDDIIKTIFCIQTPHTGSSLAEIAGWFAGDARDDLKISSMEEFNKSYGSLVGNIYMYSTYSSNYNQVLNSRTYKAAAKIIATENRFFYDSYYAPSDGASPMLSSMGAIRERNNIYEIQKPVEISYYWDCYLDHGSSYRHPNVLNKIMDWLGFPQSATASRTIMQIQTTTESEPEILPLHYITGFTGEIDSSSPVSETVSISDSTTAVFRALTSDVNTVFTLEDPCGIIYDPFYATAEPNVSYESDEGEGIVIYEVNEPMPGIWTLNLTTTIASPNFVSYGLTAFEDTKITLNSYTDVDWENTDVNVLVLSELSTNNSPIINADIAAEITLPDSNTVSLVLFDDGLHEDGNADDGLYANIFTDTNQIGTYNSFISAVGSLSGVGFERSGSLSFTISSPDVSFGGDINDAGVDLNANGLYDALRFTIPVDVCEPNDYLLTARLSDSNDVLIRQLSSGTINLSTGPNTITLDVEAEDIVANDVNGPYKLSDITVSDANTGLTIDTTTDYNTAAYNVNEFEPLDTDSDGVCDNFELSIGTNISLADSDFDGVSDYNEVGYDGDANSYNPVTDINAVNTDTDSDGMDDGWEINFGYDPLVDDGAKDNDDDGDGLTNLVEFQKSTLPDNNDTDGDGITDGNEVNVHTTNPTNPDTDGDGILDGVDNCKKTANPNQEDLDGDGIGNICDNCLNNSNPDQSDMDSDGIGDECDCLADLSNDNFIDFEDLAMFASHWLDINCKTPDYCGATDFNKSGTVDFNDLLEIADKWLTTGIN